MYIRELWNISVMNLMIRLTLHLISAIFCYEKIYIVMYKFV